MAFSSNLQYFAWIIAPVLWAVIAYRLMSASGRKVLLFESSVNITAGLILGVVFTKSGVMSGIGVLCVAAMLLRMCFRVWKIYKIESAE